MIVRSFNVYLNNTVVGVKSMRNVRIQEFLITFLLASIFAGVVVLAVQHSTGIRTVAIEAEATHYLVCPTVDVDTQQGLTAIVVLYNGDEWTVIVPTCYYNDNPFWGQRMLLRDIDPVATPHGKVMDCYVRPIDSHKVRFMHNISWMNLEMLEDE